jgi:beta-lactamase superfamily II metal-dependent hydrolase
MVEPTLSILDVGHGNCAVLFDDRVIVIDAGPGTTLLEFLEREGIKEVSVVLVSHADEDHVKGLVALVESRAVNIDTIRVNSDAIKESSTWSHLAFLLDEENKAGHIRFEVGLTTNQTDQFNTPSITVEILAPSPGIAMKGAGSRDHKGRKLTSNTMSAVVRLLREGAPLVLLPGDLDETGLDNLIESGRDLRAAIAVFPHHGGGPASSDLSKFASTFCSATGAQTLIFSIGRGRYGTPRPEIIAAARTHSANLRVLCTQLSERCASELPKSDPIHLTDKISRGREQRKCCAGTLVLNLGKSLTILPVAEAHLQFISNSAPSALCTKPQAASR